VAGRTLNLLPARAGDWSAALASHVFFYLFSRKNSVADVVALSFLGGHPSKKSFLGGHGWLVEQDAPHKNTSESKAAGCLHLSTSVLQAQREGHQQG